MPVALPVIAQPQAQLDSLLAPLEIALAHEPSVTRSIYAIYEAAQQARDFRSMQFLDWFVKEQDEEEKRAEDLIQKFKLFVGDAKGLYMLDRALAARVYVAPTLGLQWTVKRTGARPTSPVGRTPVFIAHDTQPCRYCSL